MNMTKSTILFPDQIYLCQNQNNANQQDAQHGHHVHKASIAVAAIHNYALNCCMSIFLYYTYQVVQSQHEFMKKQLYVRFNEKPLLSPPHIN